ncbi:MAG: hypothetical protein OEY59_10380, partial [Deltaproteobacteria bacterium]|nr:hypothetical protein [Deltaproteobacteria bacterium]
MNNPRFNVIILIIFLVIGSLFLSVFNLVVDPFGIYKIMTVKGLNERKPEIKKHITLVKTLSVNKIKPKSVILGSSRAAFGFDPEYNVWSQKPVYNMAFPGIDISATYQYFKDALNQKSVKTVVLAVDFFMFNRYLNNKNGIDNAILNINESINKRLKYYVRLVSINFSIDTLMSSVSTLMNQSGDEDAYKPNGQMSRKYLEKILEEAGGHRESFIISERNFLTVMWFPEPGYGFQFADKTGNSFDSFVSILELAYNENIDLKILISPSHARHWESLEAVGLWPLFEKWKEKMVILNENKARELNKTPFDLWDFSGYNEYTTE